MKLGQLLNSGNAIIIDKQLIKNNTINTETIQNELVFFTFLFLFLRISKMKNKNKN